MVSWFENFFEFFDTDFKSFLIFCIKIKTPSVLLEVERLLTSFLYSRVFQLLMDCYPATFLSLAKYKSLRPFASARIIGYSYNSCFHFLLFNITHFLLSFQFVYLISRIVLPCSLINSFTPLKLLTKAIPL